MITPTLAAIDIDRLSVEYPKLINYVMLSGIKIPSRIGETREILNLKLTLFEPMYCIVGREGFSRRFMREEILQILAGVHDNKRLHDITPRAAELITPATAYGPRTWEQLERCERELKESPTSRRAVVYVGRHDDLDRSNDETRANEMPCTETWQFHLRDRKLQMTVNMRSWDLVWGLGYDIPSFVAVQAALARALGAEVGWYTHNAGSGHIYDRHYKIQTWPREESDGLLRLDDVLDHSIRRTRLNALAVVGHTELLGYGNDVRFMQ